MTLARPMFPPPVGRESYVPYDPALAAARDGHPLADLIALRQFAADQIESLLAFLDATDAPDDYEPSHGRCPDPDEIDEAELDTADDEPSYGAPERHPNAWGPAKRFDQTLWAQGNDDEREDECEDEGAVCEDEGANQGDDEPSLCGINADCYLSEDRDLEDQCEDEGAFEDNGIADLDGLLEQYSGLSGARAASGSFASGYARGVE